MKKAINSLMILGLMPFLVSCGPAFLKKIINDNPEIITESIKNNPEKYMEALSEAQRKYIQKQREKEEKQALQAMEDEFKNPKKPETPDSRVYFGKKEAPITIVEYSDFLCGFCSRASFTLKRLLENYPDQVRVLYKHLPVTHPAALPAAKYYEAIGKQDVEKARKFHDSIFADQAKVRQDGEKHLKKLAQEMGVNMKKLEAQLKSVEKIVQQDQEEARRFGFNGTPGFLVGGVTVSGARSFNHFKTIIDRHLQASKGEKEGEK